jgi:hypothetical protein
MTVPIGLIDLIYLSQVSFLLTPWTSKSFKLSHFLAPRSRFRIARVLQTERHLFSQEVNHHIVICYTYKDEHH